MIHFALFSFQGTTWFFNRRSAKGGSDSQSAEALVLCFS
jgi:hypothetical protein